MSVSLPHGAQTEIYKIVPHFILESRTTGDLADSSCQKLFHLAGTNSVTQLSFPEDNDLSLISHCLSGTRLLGLRKDLLAQLLRDPASYAFRLSEFKAVAPELNLQKALQASPILLFQVQFVKLPADSLPLI